MKPFTKLLLLAVAFALIQTVACKKDLDVKSYRLPVAEAGPDAQIVLPLDSILLDGSASQKTDQEIASYEWGMILGSSTVQIRSPKLSKTMVVGLKEGINQFELKVKDVLGQVDRDTVLINVARMANPIANAGVDQVVLKPAQSVLLSGWNSIDYENDITSYLWTYLSGPASYKIHQADAMVTEVSGLVLGLYFFELKVTDAGGLTDRDTVMITVKENEVSSNPVAYIACDHYIISKEAAEVEIYASSYAFDEQGSLFQKNDAHEWTQLSGPGMALINKPEDRIYHSYTKISGLIKGTYVFQLKANFVNAVAYDTVTVYVIDEDRRGKEFVFESTWQYVWDEGLFALTPINAELFYSTSGIKMTVYIQLQNSSDWIDLSLASSIFVFYPDYCAHAIWIGTAQPEDSSSPFIGQKLLIKVRYD